jgi:hypothetical protein
LRRKVLETSSLVLPGWLAASYEAAAAADTLSPADSGVRVLPSYVPQELQILAMVVHALQQKGFVSHLNTLSISVSEISSTLPKSDPLLTQRVRRSLEELPSLRLLLPSATEPIKIFSKEAWQTRDELSLTMSPVGYELINGCVDGYQEMMRRIYDEPLLTPLLGGRAPLIVSKPVWLELTGVEQLVYFRIERAIQYDFACVHLDGVFAQEISQLFGGRRPAQKHRMEIRTIQPELIEKLRTLSKLGKKLTEHGILARNVQPVHSYMAVANSEEPSIVWQLSENRLLGVEDDSLLDKFTHSGRHIIYDGQSLDMILKILSMGQLRGDERSRVEVHWQRLKGLPANELKGLRFASCHVIDPFIMYLEWRFRSTRSHPVPLADGFLPTAVRDCLQNEDMVEGCKALIKYLADQEDFSSQIKRIPTALFSHPEFDNGIVRDFALTLKRSREVVNTLQSAVSSKVETSEQLTQASVHSDARLRKIAAEEIDRMLKFDRKSYEELRKIYYQSLDDKARRMMQEIQKKMQSSVFEDHLKQRLVRFMVENPNSWRAPRSLPI